MFMDLTAASYCIRSSSRSIASFFSLSARDRSSDMRLSMPSASCACLRERVTFSSKLAAFTLGQKMDDNMAVVHIEKADNEIMGLYTVINNQFVQHELTDVKFINREEDRGMEGLRKAKLSYYPAYMIDKFDGRPI